MEITLGLNAYHGDSAACLLMDGKLVAAAEEERYRRVKHWAGFPVEAIRYCLQVAGVSLSDVDTIAINSDPKANLWKKAAYIVTRKPDLQLIKKRLQKAQKRLSIEEELLQHFPDTLFKGKVKWVEHHRAHIASSFLASPFDEAVFLSIDGFGDFSSAAWGMGRGNKLSIDGSVYFPHSLGIFYQALTQFLGFGKYGDEYKVMGLAAYGTPNYLKEMRQIVQLNSDGSYQLNLDYFRHHNENIEMSWNGGSPHVGQLFSERLSELLGIPRKAEDSLEQHHKDIACSVQAMFEEALFHLLKKLHDQYDTSNLALSGGCAMNSAANGKIRLNTPFTNLYIPPSAGDAGGAVGAALSVWSANTSGSIHSHLDHASFGNSYDDEAIELVVDEYRERLTESNCIISKNSSEELIAECVDAIDSGMIIGWFQGRMEWGPRALGNRSILADPRRADMRDRLNKKIKLRETFRPLAPAILREAVGDWFESDYDVSFMSEVFSIREEKRPLIPAVTHIDGSGRLQSIRRDTNPLYYDLIKAFHAKTGVPLLMNTSFNENEPIVCRPQEALDCFLRTRMDLLVMGSFIIRRNED
ncbi:MAG: carbamoyltransferase [Magnetococcales bacterium]|nr:carbamoyltransferase [Magnetococcales bacterium]